MFNLGFCIDFVINIILIFSFYMLCDFIKNKNSRNVFLIFFKYCARILQLPLTLYFSFLFILHKDNLFSLFLGQDLLYYLLKMKKFLPFFYFLLILSNILNVFYDIKLKRNINNNRNFYRLYALKTFTKIMFIVIFIIFTIAFLSIFDIEPYKLILSIGTPLTVLTLSLKGTIEDIYFGIFLMVSNKYKNGDYVKVVSENIVGNIINFNLKFVEIMTNNGDFVSIRNSLFCNSIIINRTLIGFSYLQFSIFIRFKDINSAKNFVNNINLFFKKKSKSEKYIVDVININNEKMEISCSIPIEMKKGSKKIDLNDIKFNIMLDFLQIANENNCILENIEGIIK